MPRTMKPSELRSKIQTLLFDNGFDPGAIDSEFGAKTYAAIRALDLASDEPLIHRVKASSFADPADIFAFRRCKLRGGTDQECFKLGDNGIGIWGDDTTKDACMCALPYEDWMEKWGNQSLARGKMVKVTVGEKSVICILGDTLPHRSNIGNGAGIDLNPSACKALGLIPPVMATSTWQWA